MTLENKLGITSSFELAHEKELLTKHRALELYDNEPLGAFEVGTFTGLAKIHGYLLQDVYDFADKMRTVNIAKGGFRFVPSIHVPEALEAIGKMSQSTFDKIDDRQIYMKSIDASYSYEGYSMYSIETLP